jgi:hypothetical protein
VVFRDDYSLASDPINDNTIKNYEVGAYYTPPAGNELGFRAIHQVETVPVEQLYYGVPVDNSYNSDTLLATCIWESGGRIRATGQTGVVRVSHKELSSLDFNASTWRGKITWLASGKSWFDVSIWKEISPNYDETTNYTLNKGISLGAVWNPTAKLSVASRVTYLKADYVGNPEQLLATQLTRHDNDTTASLSVNYQPIRAVGISASIQTERRSSNIEMVGYSDKNATLSASFEF